MREVLYTKYNSKRKPIYQLSTSIVQEGENRFAMKKAIQPKAKKHLISLVENRKKLEALYQKIEIVECQLQEEEILFPFVKGKHLLEDINLANGKIIATDQQRQAICGAQYFGAFHIIATYLFGSPNEIYERYLFKSVSFVIGLL